MIQARPFTVLSSAVAVAGVFLSTVPLQAQQRTAPARPKASVEQVFKQWDRDGDGKLTLEEVPNENLFKMLDRNGDGVVTLEEAKAFGGGDRRAAKRQSETAAELPPAEGFKSRQHGDEAKAAGLKPDVLATLDVEMQRHIAAHNVSGVVGLIHRNGQRGYFEAFGWLDIEAQKGMPKNAIFRLQSMTKPIIAACAMSLFDAGKFTLDESIAKHLPEWKEPKVLENGKLVPAKFAITARMLMSHSSGLYYGTLEGGPFSGGAGRGAQTTLESFSWELAKRPLKLQPGAGWQYGHSIDVLGRYIEVVAGKPLDEVLKERILGPLKMVDTDFWVHPENAGRICQIYKQPRPGVLERGREAGKLTEKPTLFLGGQGLCSTTEDYERFCRMMLNRGELDGVRVLKPETVDLMFQNHVKPEVGRQYGLGGAVDGEGGYAWGGANGTQFWLDRKNGLFAIFMVQTQLYRAPTYNTFKRLANESAGIASGRAAGMFGEDSAVRGSPDPALSMTAAVRGSPDPAPGMTDRSPASGRPAVGVSGEVGRPAPSAEDGAAADGGRGITSLFKQRDRNGDGKLDRSELPGAWSVLSAGETGRRMVN
jgi:CubicO group peptidase (beta-lactamase class C family)